MVELCVRDLIQFRECSSCLVINRSEVHCSRNTGLENFSANGNGGLVCRIHCSLNWENFIFPVNTVADCLYVQFSDAKGMCCTHVWFLWDFSTGVVSKYGIGLSIDIFRIGYSGLAFVGFA